MNRTNRTHARRASLLAVAATIGATGLAACGDDPADKVGEVEITIYGEAFIEEGIPAEEFEDGWAVTFDSFVVTVSNVTVGGAGLASPPSTDISLASDGGGHSLGSITAPTGTHDNPSFTIDRVVLSGHAVRDEVTKSFTWTFDQHTHYHDCDTSTTVDESAPATFQITVHADHYFYDSLVSADPSLVFQELADADTDNDGVITQAELEAAEPLQVDTGSSSDIDSLWAYLEALNRTLGHVDGEGHCAAN